MTEDEEKRILADWKTKWHSRIGQRCAPKQDIILITPNCPITRVTWNIKHFEGVVVGSGDLSFRAEYAQLEGFCLAGDPHFPVRYQHRVFLLPEDALEWVEEEEESKKASCDGPETRSPAERYQALLQKLLATGLIPEGDLRREVTEALLR